MVDRDARDAVIVAVEQFLNGEIGSHEFDDNLFSIETEDPTVKDVVSTLWLLYDDLTDHRMHLDKEGWDYIQRLILILKSDAHIETIKNKEWSASQGIAGGALSIAGLFVDWLTMSMVCLVPLGALSMLISAWRWRTAKAPDSYELAVSPFSSITEIAQVRRAVPQFSKKPFQKSHADGPIERRWIGRLSEIQVPQCVVWLLMAPFLGLMAPLWMLLSPIVLVVQSLPNTRTETRVVLP